MFSERKSPRADFHNYSGGCYFITVCTKDKIHYFGRIADGKMYYTALGDFCRLQLEKIHDHYSYAEVLQFVVMPNHIHAVISIKPQYDDNSFPAERTALSVVVGGLKRAVTLFSRRNNFNFAWQGRYHDHIIRGKSDIINISNYIDTNIDRWDMDCFYSE